MNSPKEGPHGSPTRTDVTGDAQACTCGAGGRGVAAITPDAVVLHLELPRGLAEAIHQRDYWHRRAVNAEGRVLALMNRPVGRR